MSSCMRSLLLHRHVNDDFSQSHWHVCSDDDVSWWNHHWCQSLMLLQTFFQSQHASWSLLMKFIIEQLINCKFASQDVSWLNDHFESTLNLDSSQKSCDHQWWLCWRRFEQLMMLTWLIMKSDHWSTSEIAIFTFHDLHSLHVCMHDDLHMMNHQHLTFTE